MPFNFLDQNESIREFMLAEVEYDLGTNNLYLSKRFSEEGKDQYVNLLKQSINEGSEVTLSDSLSAPGIFNETEIRTTEKGEITAKVPITAPTTFAEGEFNRFYMRAVCLKAIADNREVEVYRAKEVSNPRLDSEGKIGEKINPQKLLEDLRKNTGVDTSLGLPVGPNSGLSIKLI